MFGRETKCWGISASREEARRRVAESEHVSLSQDTEVSRHVGQGPPKTRSHAAWPVGGRDTNPHNGN